MNPARRGIAAASVAAVLWGLGTVATAAVLERGVPPGPFTVVELASSVAFLGVLAVVTRTRFPTCAVPGGRARSASWNREPPTCS